MLITATQPVTKETPSTTDLSQATGVYVDERTQVEHLELYWLMLEDCERRAAYSHDPELKKLVERACANWGQITASEVVPSWQQAPKKSLFNTIKQALSLFG